MMPKVTMLAPAGLGGHIHASKSGKNYDIAADGTVVVDAVDAADLISAGFQHAPIDRATAGPQSSDPDKSPITSDAPGSTVTGASAIDPDKREAAHRKAEIGDGQQNSDFGKATPPHGLPGDGSTSDPATEEAQHAEARSEVDTAERSGADADHRSHLAGTANMSATTVSKTDQDAARDDDDPEHPSSEGVN